MPRIAIVIGVSNYVRQQSLAACKNDAELVRFVLDSSKEYEDILHLSGSDTNSDDVKFQLTQFVEKHKGRTDLDEVFFFYSGHGLFYEDEFYYVLSDFEESRRNRTSLKNSELDGYLRTLSPNVAIKIVDACNAGVQYVKDAGGIETIIAKATKDRGLKKVYFMFSSLFDQNSFASSDVSHYTRSLIEAIYSYNRAEIRYRDIVDQISDQFENNRDQRPFFVIQADNTEIFGSFSDKQKTQIRSKFEAIITSSTKTKANTPSPAKQPTLADIIKEQAKDYLTETEMVESIDQLKKVAENFSLQSDIVELFNTSVQAVKDFQGLKGLDEIGKWLNENKKEYYARIVTRVEEYEGYASDALGAYARILSSINTRNSEAPKKITKTRKVISGYEMQWDAPSFWRVELYLESLLPNIPSFKLNIVYLFSRLDIRVFYSISEEMVGPKGITANIEHGEWKALQFRLRDLRENPSVLNPVFLDFTHSVVERLKQIAGIPKEQVVDISEIS